MSVRVEVVTFTTDGAGDASVLSPSPIMGEILSVRVPESGTTWAGTAGTADMTITRRDDGGTIVALTDFAMPVQVQPRDPHHIVDGTLAGTADSTLIPVSGYVSVVVGDAQATQAGTVHIYYRGR